MTITTDPATLTDPATGGAQPTVTEFGSVALLLASGGETYTYATGFTKYWSSDDLAASLVAGLRIDYRDNAGFETVSFVPNNENDVAPNKATPVAIIVVDRGVTEDVAVSHVMESNAVATHSFNSITTTAVNTLVFAVAVLDDDADATVLTWPVELVDV